MRKIYVFLLTIYFWTVTIIVTLFVAFVCMALYFFISFEDFVFLYEILGSTLLLKSMTIFGFWSFKIKDLRVNKNFSGNCVLIANHASFIDTILVGQIPIRKRYMMHHIFTKIPIFGHMCLMAGHIPVNPKDPASRKQAYLSSVKALKEGGSFMIYPEGTRNPNPTKLMPFKTGAFRLAQNANVPILPLILKNTGVAMPIGGLCYFADLELIICDPIEIEVEWDHIEKAIKKSTSLIENYLAN